MTRKFEFSSDDPPEVHLAAALMENIGPGFTDWLGMMAMLAAQPGHVAGAASAAIATLLSLMINHVAQTDKRAEAIKIVCGDIESKMLKLLETQDAKTAAEEPDASYH